MSAATPHDQPGTTPADRELTAVQNRADDDARHAVNATADATALAANRAADAAMATAVAAEQAAADARHGIADEEMSTANRSADHAAYNAHRAVDEAVKATGCTGGEPTATREPAG